MSHENEMGTKPSFFTRHLHITGIETSTSVTEADVAADLQIMDGFELPGLDLRSVAKSSEEINPVVRLIHASRNFLDQVFARHGELIGVAAMLLLFILPFSTMQHESVVSESIRAKGSDKVTIYRERGGQVSQIAAFDQPLALENGDRIRVEVLAGNVRHAFYFISSKAQARVLTTVNDMLTERLNLKAGDRAIFPGSIELVGENEGESLNILLCNDVLSEVQLTEMINEYPMGGTVTPKSCLLKTIRLR